MKKSILIFFSFVFGSACLCQGSPEVYYTPNRATDQIIMELLKKAEKTVYVASYTMSWQEVSAKLLERSSEIDVKIMLDLPPPMRFSEKTLKVDDKSALFHSKFIVVDGENVLVGSGNFTEGSMHFHHNNFLLIKERRVAEFFEEKFLSLWEGDKSYKSYSDKVFKIYFSPESDCEKIISDIISSAKKSIRFALYHFTSENIAKSILHRRLAGVDVYGIVERLSIEPYSTFYSLKDYGCVMKKSNLAGFLHDKFFIIDDEIVITGSYNPTAAARRNTETLLIVKDKDVANNFVNEWKRLWRYHALP